MNICRIYIATISLYN